MRFFLYLQQTAAHRSAINHVEPNLWNEPLRSQLVLASLDGLISCAAKVHLKVRKRNE